METTLDKFGRIVIPKKIRDDLHLEPGDQIRVEENGQAIVLKPVHGEPNLVLKDGILVFSGTPTGNLDEAITKHREKRIKSVGKGK
ncbi:MAG: AbrB/MazE/SpoVT family DNA-binding domain-containing protein [Proteobacteria bacterium]|nr:AbrB/MazE/SpoVT family DNA-binding domain-containing protein [Pseudomonadota bacterium]